MTAAPQPLPPVEELLARLDALGENLTEAYRRQKDYSGIVHSQLSCVLPAVEQLAAIVRLLVLASRHEEGR